MEILSFLLLLAIGGFAGWAATKVFKTSKQNNMFNDVLIGVIGAVIGKFILDFIGFEATKEGVIVDFIAAFVGAVILVGASKLVAGKILNKT